jgi:RNA polymerase sigma-70 factor (ECF subfamily)
MVIADDRLESAATAELLSDAREGDAQAFCLLIEPLQTRLLRQAAALAGDLGDAEDLVSETLVEAWKSFARYGESCRLSTWLYAILLHRFQKSVRRARSRPISLARLPLVQADELHERQQNVPSSGPLPADEAAQQESFLHLRRCVELLPEKHRQIVLLRFFEDASLPDIATVLGCSVGTVKSRLHHALDKLRKMKMNLPDMKGDEQA